MALLSAAYLSGSIRHARCARFDVALRDDEYLLSRKAAPFLYDGALAISDKPAVAFCESVFEALPPLMEFDRTQETRCAVLGFCSLLMKQPALTREEFVHWTLFEFWDEVWNRPEDRIPLVEKYYEGAPDALGKGTKFGREILPRLRATDDAYPDIVGLGGRGSRELVLAEVKLEGIDDRAVGQILRYYQLGRAVCDAGMHTCDIRGVLPVLIVREVKLAFWETFPLHFRELLQVLTYRFNARNCIELIDCRRALAQQARARTVFRG